MRFISTISATVCLLSGLVPAASAAGEVAARPIEISTVQPAGMTPAGLPASVSGLLRRGRNVQTQAVALKNKAGKVRPEALPAVAVLHGVAWSPDDAAREGAGEMEILICAARLLDQRSLAGIVGVGNRNGSFIPAAEVALQRIASMGLPVVRLARGNSTLTDTDNLFIEGGELTPHQAKELLATCLLRHGALPPAADTLKPTAQELAAIKSKLALYQQEFDLLAGTRVALR
jgi:hypothetical protein